jgi:hypothetical protein
MHAAMHCNQITEAEAAVSFLHMHAALHCASGDLDEHTNCIVDVILQCIVLLKLVPII